MNSQVPERVRLLHVIILGAPEGKGRHNTDFVNRRHYTPKKTRAYEQRVGIAASVEMARMSLQPLDIPLALDIIAYMPIPESWSKKRKAAALAGDELPAKKPDPDNILKAVADGMNTIVYTDDAKIVATSVLKLYSDEPRVVASVSFLRKKV